MISSHVQALLVESESQVRWGSEVEVKAQVRGRLGAHEGQVRGRWGGNQRPGRGPATCRMERRMRSASLRLPAVFASLGPMLCSRSRLRDIACRFESTCTGEGGAVSGGEWR